METESMHANGGWGGLLPERLPSATMLSEREHRTLSLATSLVFRVETSLGRNPIGRKEEFKEEVFLLYRIFSEMETEIFEESDVP